MTTAVIEINDAGLLVTDGAGRLSENPGYAILEDDRILVGEAALGQARLRPNRMQNRFWDQLSTEPLAKPWGVGVKNLADIAFAQLSELWEGIRGTTNEVVLVVPGNYSRQQLGLLLGMARECRMPVVELMDVAIASSGIPMPGRELTYLDIGLHRTLLTRLEQGEYLRRIRVDELASAGVIDLYDRWANFIADVFIKDTRFDPLHVAQTEQKIYDHMPGWLARLDSQPSVAIEVHSQGKGYQVNIKREQLLKAASGFYRQLAEQVTAGRAQPIALQISHRVAALPGLVETLERSGDCQVIPLERGAAAYGALLHKTGSIESGTAVRFTTSIPWSVSGEASVPVEASSDAELPPSHVVYRGLAYSINAHPLDVGLLDEANPPGGLRPGECSLTRVGETVYLDAAADLGLEVNGRKIDRKTELEAGDRISINDGGDELLLIALVDEYGTEKAGH